MVGGERGRLEGDRRILQVSDVLRAIEDQFHIAFPRRVWVFGTVRGLRGAAGTDSDLEFLLTEAHADPDTEVRPQTLPSELDAASYADIDASLRRLHDVAVEDLLVEGHLIRAGGLLSYDTIRHTVVFTVTALDPQPTTAWLADRRQEVREAVDEARLGERQRDIQVPMAPRSVGLVAAQDDPMLAEVGRTLAGGGFDIEVAEYPVRETGIRMGDGLANAVREAGLGGHDLVLLIRDYGRPLALAPYDAEPVIRAVAGSPIPVVTGLGAPNGPAVVEAVAHQAYPTAGEAADAVLRRLHRASELVEEAVEAVSAAGDEALRRAALRVEQTRQVVSEDLRQARGRAEAARRRRLLRVRLAAAALAVVIVLAAVLTKTYLLLVALVVPLALALFSERLRPQRRRGPVSVTELSFAAALQRLGGIRRDLEDVADPDVVDQLEQEAASLAEHCRSLLRRPRSLRTRQAPTVATDDSPTGPVPLERSPGQSDEQRTATAPGSSASDDGTVALPTEPQYEQERPTDIAPGAETERAESERAETERIEIERPETDRAEGPRRTITLPGDAPTTVLSTESSADTASDPDDAPTTTLHRQT